jgi:8-oxo-dGTP pyrophosphatase MutT (NUDIX family)
MKKVRKALMFIYRIRDGQREFFVLDRKSGDHVVLTGHQEKGETIKETAIRETIEEIEVEPLNIEEVDEVNTVILENGGKESKEYPFLIEIPNKDVEYLKGKEKHSWHRTDELENILTYSHQKKVIKKIRNEKFL